MKKLSSVTLACIVCLIALPFKHVLAKSERDTTKTKPVGSFIEVKVGDLKQYGESELVVELEPKDGKSDYVLPVVIGACEITGIYEQVHNVSSPRPLTYDLMVNIFKATDIKLEKIAITELKDGVFYALITLNNNGKIVEVDSRPSDAINLAMRYSAPIYVANEVFEEAKEHKTPVDVKPTNEETGE